MRVLIISAGKKVGLVNAFKEAGAKVFAADADLSMPACKAADDVWSIDYSYEFDLLIPTRDAELRQVVDVQGAVVSPLGTIKTCTDKAEFSRFCLRHGFKTPETYRIDSPIIFKPRSGAGSRGLITIDRSYIGQELITDTPEYSIDYFADFEGRTLSCIPRKRLNVVNGESQDCEIVKDDKLIAEATRLGQELGIIGPATMQCFYDGLTIKWIEVNARFGGGSHFTWHLFNSPKWLVENYKCMPTKKFYTTPQPS